MRPYYKFWLKSFAVFVGAMGLAKGGASALGQISLIDWFALLSPGVLALAAYWGGVADSMPAPWNTQTKEAP